MKAVLISIQPKWCELIANGKKTVEVRKTKPKIDVPFKVYIYETNWKDNTYWKNHHKGRLGKVIGEFVCDSIYKGILQKTYFVDSVNIGYDKTCVPIDDLAKYLGVYGVCGEYEFYGWHISDLVIYDKPRELWEFIMPSKIGCCNEGKCRGCKYLDCGNGYNIEDDCNAKFSTDEFKPLRRPPQSWCYVEVEE